MKHPDASDERLREAFTEVASGAAPGQDCPSHEQIWEAVRGKLPEDDTAAFLDHALDCARCTEALAMAREITGGMDAGEPAAEERARFRPGIWVGLAAAAAISAFLIVPALRDRSTEMPDSMRDVGGSSGPASLLTADGSLPRDAFTLRWAGQDGAVYDVEVVDEDLRVLDRATGLRTDTYTVPPERLAALPPGAAVLWHVDATLPGGDSVSSDVFRAVVSD